MRRSGFIIALLPIGGLALAAASWWVGGELVKPVPRPVSLPPDYPAEVVSIPSEGGALAGWWTEAGPTSPAVLLLHSIRADRTSMVPRARLLQQHGFSTLLIDFQAHGESPGSAITLGWRESEDARAALAWLRQKVDGSDIGVVGCSLGGAAVLLGAQPAGFGAVVLEAVYPRLSSAVENRIRIRLGPAAPVLTPLLLWQMRPRLGLAPSSLVPIEGIARLGAPVLVMAGSHDRHTTARESRELFEAAHEPKQLWIVEGAAHQDLFAFDPSAYEARVIPFLAEHL